MMKLSTPKSFAERLHNDSTRHSVHGLRVLDWDKAEKIVQGTKGNVFAGLAEDWANTCGIIGKDGVPVYNEKANVLSMWKTPVVVVKYGHGIPCWKHATDDDISGCPDWWGA